VHLDRIGFTPVKGGRHLAHDTVELTTAGPAGDRAFCLVDRARGRVLRTVENPSLLRTVSRWGDGTLHVDLPGGEVSGTPRPTGERLKVDYWGRVAEVEVVAGPWGAAYSEHLACDPIVLARAARPGEVVYGAPVSLVTTSALRELEGRLGRPVDSARFRATLLVDDDDAPPDRGDDDWVGRELRIGEATVLVRGQVPRCAVVDLDPRTGARDLPVLHTLAGYRRSAGVVRFGVDAVVTRPGRVCIGEPVSAASAAPSSGRS